MTMDQCETSPLDAAVLQQFASTIRYQAHSVHRRYTCISVEDLMQVGNEAVLRAHRKYSPDGGATFRTYGERTIKTFMIDAARAEKRALRCLRVVQADPESGARRTVGNVASDRSELMHLFYDGVGECVLVVDAEAATPETNLECSEEARRFSEGTATLTPRQREYIELRRQGYSDKRIAVHWGVDKSTVSHTASKAKAILQRFVRDGAGER